MEDTDAIKPIKRQLRPRKPSEGLEQLVKRIKTAIPPKSPGGSAESPSIPPKTNISRAPKSPSPPSVETAPIGECLLCKLPFHTDRAMLLHLKALHCADIIKLNFDDNSQKSEPLILTTDTKEVKRSETLQVSPGDQNSSSSNSSPTESHSSANIRSTQSSIPLVKNLGYISTVLSGDLGYFMCPDCSRTFECVEAFSEHLDQHMKLRSASIAPVTPSARNAPETTANRTSVESVFKCLMCNARFQDVNRYQDHLKTHGANSFSCERCGQIFGTQFELNRHMGSHTGMSHGCPICGMCFKNRRNLEHHHHLSHIEQPAIQCQVCGKVFAEASQLKAHATSHLPDTKPYHCSFCHWRFSNAYDLELHEKMHSSDRCFECSQCNKSFLKLSLLNSHLQVDHGSKEDGHSVAFDCLHCNKSYLSPQALSDHMTANHKDKIGPLSISVSTSDSSQICAECGDSFPDHQTFQLHKLTHEPALGSPSSRQQSVPTVKSASSSSPIDVDGKSVCSDASGISDTNSQGGSGYVHKPITHHLDNDYLDGLLDNICRKPPSHRQWRRNKSKEPETSTAHSAPNAPTARSSDSSAERKQENSDSSDPNPNQPSDIISPLQNDYFKNLVQSNIQRYSRQRIRDPVEDYINNGAVAASLNTTVPLSEQLLHRNMDPNTRNAILAIFQRNNVLFS